MRLPKKFQDGKEPTTVRRGPSVTARGEKKSCDRIEVNGGEEIDEMKMEKKGIFT